MGEPTNPTVAPDEDWLTTEDLLAQAVPLGVQPPSESQLKRMRKGGLLPRPLQRHVPGCHGSKTFWPPNTAPQLAALLRLREEHGRHGPLLLALWWEGWDVDQASLRAELGKLLDEGPDSLHLAGNDEGERLEALASKVEAVDFSHTGGALGRIIRRAGPSPEDRISLLIAILALGVGIDVPLDRSEAQLFDDEPHLADIVSAGLDLAGRAASLSSGEESVTADDLLATLNGLPGQSATMWNTAREVVIAGEWGELCVARDAGRTLLEDGPAVSQFLKLANPQHPSGALFDDFDLPFRIRVALGTVSALWFRRTIPDAVQAVTDAIASVVPKARAFGQVVDAVPGLRELLVEANGDQELLARLAGERPDLQAAMATYLVQHPDVAKLLED
jgi:hypothetical protein